jgi:PilZ domain
MGFDRRRKTRRLIDVSAKLFTGVDAPVWDCVVMDISENGARIALDSVDEIPEQFTLLLVSYGHTSRACRVVWRAGRQLGVRFEAAASLSPPINHPY